MRQLASSYNEKANQLKDEGKFAEAIEYYQKAINATPTWASPWYNLGLLHKYQGNWAESFRCNQRAAELDPQDEAALWNLGIAATALNNWPAARRAWKTYGLEMPEGDGPIEENFGLTPIRLNPNGDGEVVWCRRIDPARAIIDSIPFPESGHRYGDLLLNDGAPTGYRRLQDQEVPVFDELELLLPSEFGTYVVTLDYISATELEDLSDVFIKQGLCAENWATNTRILCKACSEGKPFDADHQHAEVESDEASPSSVNLAFAATSEQQINDLLRDWRTKYPHVEVVELACLLEPARTN